MVAALLLAATLCVCLGFAPEESFDDRRSAIAREDDLNNGSTEGAPQQEVVNGWTTIAYLELLSEQQERSDNRRDGLLVVGLVGLATLLLTGQARPASRPPAA